MIDPKFIDVSFAPDGMIEQSPQSEESGLMGAGAKTFPDNLRIGQSEVRDRIASMDKHKSWAENYRTHFTHQGRSHECVSHASQVGISVAYNRAVGAQNDVWFSPLALYTRITGGRQWGGSNVQDALFEMIEAGMIPEDDGSPWMGGENGQKERFKHTLHRTAGFDEPFVKPRDLPDGWEDTARHFTVLEAYTIPDPEAHLSALLHGWCVVNGRRGHSIPHTFAKDDNGTILSGYADSYDRILYDSRKLWGGGFCVRSVNYPHDVERPAGEDMK